MEQICRLFFKLEYGDGDPFRKASLGARECRGEVRALHVTHPDLSPSTTNGLGSTTGVSPEHSRMAAQTERKRKL